MKKAQREATDRVIEAFGGLVKTAEHFGITVAAIGHWRKRGMPLKYLKEAVLKSGETREQLRPDLYA